MKKATRLKNGTQVCSGKNCCAKARAIGDDIQLTFITGMKPALHVAWTLWIVLAPAMMAMQTRYTLFWIGAIWNGYISNAHFQVGTTQTIKLLTRIWRILALKLVRPAKIL